MRRFKLLVVVLVMCYAVKGCGVKPGLDYEMKNDAIPIIIKFIIT